jgi:hypothetical protein
MEKETQLQFRWIKRNPSFENLLLDIKCTIPLNVGDKYIHTDENGNNVHLTVDYRLLVQDDYANILVIVFEEDYKQTIKN